MRLHRTGVKRFRHPAVGRLDLTFDAMEIPTDRSLTMTCYTAEPGTASEENLKLLASWAATVKQDAGMVKPQGSQAEVPPASAISRAFRCCYSRSRCRPVGLGPRPG